jgi:hypothetical protein
MALTASATFAATLTTTWTGQEFIVACRVCDASHVSFPEPGVWQGDSIQLAWDFGPDLHRFKDYGDPGLFGVGFALQPDGSVRAESGGMPAETDEQTILDAIQCQAVHQDGTTDYVVTIPWKSVGRNRAGEPVSLSVLVNNYNVLGQPGQGREMLGFGGGIARGNDPGRFIPVFFDAEASGIR